MMAATFLRLKRSSFMMAASTIAPDISTTSFILSRNSLEAYIISDSSTRIMSLSIPFKKEKVTFPMLVRTPSASVTGGY